ncbi:MAG: hypothetical protein L0207_05455 [Chlamydiae bacterium]|nr:hypothetical protein [Chlamydiota bacterium]
MEIRGIPPFSTPWETPQGQLSIALENLQNLLSSDGPPQKVQIKNLKERVYELTEHLQDEHLSEMVAKLLADLDEYENNPLSEGGPVKISADFDEIQKKLKS